MKQAKICSIRALGVMPTMNLTVDSPDHLFFGNGIVTSNSHAVSYGALTAVELWLKGKYPVEYITALITTTQQGKKKFGDDTLTVEYTNYARRRGIPVLNPDINKSGSDFIIDQGAIRYSLAHVRYVANSCYDIVAGQPFADMADFVKRAKSGNRAVNKRVVESLIASGAFDQWGTRNEMAAKLCEARKKKEEPLVKTDAEWLEAEKEAIGLVLSRPPLFKNYEAMILKHGWQLVAEADHAKKTKVFGKIENVVPKVSKAGNAMLYVTISDGLDSTNFYVFQKSKQFFKDTFKVGWVGVVPFDHFKDDGVIGMRFFDDRGECLVLAK